MTTLLDASAILALINEESGMEKVEAVLDDAAISTVNVAEVASKLSELAWPAADIRELINDLNLAVLPFSTESALACGALRPATKRLGLSLGDRACLATAALEGSIAMTADTAWQQVQINGLTVECIR